MLFTCTLDMALDLHFDYMSVGFIVYAGQDEVENADWYPIRILRYAIQDGVLKPLRVDII